MKNHALISLIRAKYAGLPHRQQSVVMLCSVVVGALLIIILLKCCVAIAANKKNTLSEPMIIRKENNIILPKHSPLRQHITINTVKLSAAPHIVSFPGVVEADPSHIVNILPPLTGRLTALKVKLGDKVKRGQPLAVIRSPGLAQASADYDRAVSLFKLSSEALKRAQRVYRAGGNSIKDVEIAQNNQTQAQAEMNRTRATLKTLGKNSASLLHIKSPIEGRITGLYYGRGSYINDPTLPLFTISNIKLVWVTAYIPENLAGVVAANQTVDVLLPAYPQKVWHGTVTFVNDFLEPDTRRNKTRIAFENPDRKMQPNMFATVNIALNQPDQIMVPVSAILMNDDTTSVYIESTPWTFIRREVVLGTEDGDRVRVIAGLKAGDRIVSSGGVLVND